MNMERTNSISSWSDIEIKNDILNQMGESDIDMIELERENMTREKRSKTRAAKKSPKTPDWPNKMNVNVEHKPRRNTNI